ncbi:MAG: 16S rRNA (cytidine(1402)-2'-O)-methyltransferase [Planifilum sp.]|jgi:16S rRNA (cytidine1402-2'-O)-methyltransferase
MRMQRSFEAESEEGALYIVGTPIGHLQDLSPRAREILEQVDVIAAEDTRHTRKLLTRFDIAKKPLISYHEHNRKTRGPQLIERLLAGESVALVSDAGMPAIADPGEDLVREALERGLHVIPVPGPNAAITALVASGIPPVPFVFLGFLPRHPKEREEALSRWKEAEAALVCYEAPHRVISTLESVYRVLGDRRIAVARELTKTHEEWLRGTVGEALAHLAEHPPRGEYTLVIAGADPSARKPEAAWWSSLTVEEHVEWYLRRGQSRKEAIRSAARDRSLPKREVYRIVHLENKEEQ